MLKKTIKRVLSTLLIVSIIGVLVGAIISCLGVTVGGRCVKYVDDYDGFYLYKKAIDIKPFLNFGEGGGGSGYKLWFKPGQKEKLLIKIQEQVNVELTDVVKNNSDIFYGYKINDDFKKIYIYHNKNVKLPSGIDLDTTIASRVELYHELINGYGNVEIHESIIEFVEVE